MFKFKSIAALVVFIFTALANAQITSSTLNGAVTDGDLPVVNAQVVLIFTPTNSTFDTTTDKYGRFSLDNLDVGGPYKIIVKGKEIEEFCKSDLELILGDNDLPKDIRVRRKESSKSQVDASDKNEKNKSM
ncbi:carboxypeptidase-like regulatory domain-containing protein [Flavobacterium sp. SUN046]|uniref:carboxypeptidase-like regulatory domain-containing protein n=1 Tax=Flavobacterium sp. SUN046 TaxID=3002440 RepID=UPI002DB711FF|nr:carboxypeptidase-like regulatory domain-containing protein [Flavobacterium sp. SUN046]MEC4048367.1 carboxypeptidase-like regulatory domain-containing protein [Flavobacterium sp. SUN046]